MTSKKIARTCATCGKEFYIHPSKIKYGGGICCSRKCYIGKSKKIKRICIACGKEFYVFPSRIKKGNVMYCSKKCHGVGRTTKVERICLTCGKEFYAILAKVKNGNSKYCSKKCKCIGCRTGNENKIKKICLTCGKEFHLAPSLIKNGQGKYCSKKCYMSDFGKHQTNLETKGYSILDEIGLKYEKQYKIYKYYADSYCEEYNLVIEFDGDYWHSTKIAIKKDANRNRYMLNRGYHILRLTETMVIEHPLKAKNLILKTINNISKSQNISQLNISSFMDKKYDSKLLANVV